MEYHSFHWYSIGELHIIMGLRIFLWAHRVEKGFILLVHWYDWYDWYEWNIIHSIGTPLVNCISLWGLRIFLWAHRAERGFIVLVHWYDWYEWNIIHSIGTPLVNCISLWGLGIFLWEHRAERGFIILVHWYNWYDWYQWNIIQIHIVVVMVDLLVFFKCDEGALYN